jgi:hypothetical protein
VAGRCKAPRVGTRPTGDGMERGGLWVAGSEVLQEGMCPAEVSFLLL